MVSRKESICIIVQCSAQRYSQTGESTLILRLLEVYCFSAKGIFIENLKCINFEYVSADEVLLLRSASSRDWTRAGPCIVQGF